MAKPVAVVTGASRGIGKQIAIDLAREGYLVLAAARSSSEHPSKLPGTVNDTAAEARRSGGECVAVELDVRDEEAVNELAARVQREYGRCDLLVNNAAIAPPGAALQDSTKRWRLAMDINVHGPFYLTYYLGRMLAAVPDGGRVINISSSASIWPEFGRPSYTTTKRALEAMTEALAHELRGKVAVNCIRIEVPVWSEGFAFTLPDQDFSHFEDPVILSDAVLWFGRQPLPYTGKVLTIAQMRAMGAVRPVTRIGARAKV